MRLSVALNVFTNNNTTTNKNDYTNTGKIFCLESKISSFYHMILTVFPLIFLFSLSIILKLHCIHTYTIIALLLPFICLYTPHMLFRVPACLLYYFYVLVLSVCLGHYFSCTFYLYICLIIPLLPSYAPLFFTLCRAATLPFSSSLRSFIPAFLPFLLPTFTLYYIFYYHLKGIPLPFISHHTRIIELVFL